MDIEIVHAKSNKPLVSLNDVIESSTVGEIKKSIAARKAKFRDVNRNQFVYFCFILSYNVNMELKSTKQLRPITHNQFRCQYLKCKEI